MNNFIQQLLPNNKPGMRAVPDSLWFTARDWLGENYINTGND